MKFELEPYHRNISKAEIRDDIRKVAGQLQKDAITADEYRKYGRYSPDVARRRFGSWSKALLEAGLTKTRNYDIPAAACVEDLRNIATRLGKKSVTIDEYREHGKYSPSPLVRLFGSWFNALKAAGLDQTRTLHVSDEDYFENLKEMWVSLGRQPHYNDMRKPFSKYSAGAYAYRFGSWRSALKSFIEYVNESALEDLSCEATEPAISRSSSIESPAVPSRKVPRSVSWRLRFLVMRRDNFKCCACGRSPAMQPGLVLHVDHRKAWSKDGKTVMENLQTLCEQCNIGKSDLEMTESEWS